MTRDQELNYINRKADDLEREVHALGLENERLKGEIERVRIHRSTAYDLIARMSTINDQLKADKKELVESLGETLPSCKNQAIQEYRYGSYQMYQKYDVIVKKAESILSKHSPE